MDRQIKKLIKQTAKEYNISEIKAGDFLVLRYRSSGIVIHIYLVEPDDSGDEGLTAVSFHRTGEKAHWMISDLVGRNGTMLYRLEPQEILKFLLQKRADFDYIS